MKKLLFLLIPLLLVNCLAGAQTKPAGKPDTAKAKTTPKTGLIIDTLKNVKFPLLLSTNKFDKIDSADLNLTPAIPVEKYGYVDTADLKMTSCDFEKDANALVLFDRAELTLSVPEIVLERQKRIKIFNDNGKDEANIKIEFSNKFGAGHITGLEAETITLNNGKIEYTKLDPKLVYAQNMDKNKASVVFTMPNVKAGSIIEYRYIMGKDFRGSFPEWDFQGDLPTRYSQLDAYIDPRLVFSVYYRKSHPFARDTVSLGGLGHVWALADVASTKDEPYKRSAADYLQNLTFVISGLKDRGQITPVSETWAESGKEIAEDKDFYKPFDQGLKDEDDLIKQTKVFNNDQKIAFMFNQVKTLMKWNDEMEWLSSEGIKDAWKKKSGNWGEINMILCRLLRESGINAYPMLVSTRDNGKIVPDFVNFFQINKLVVYVPVDTSKYYVLDASDKYSIYNEVPYELLNSYGLYLNKEKQEYKLVFMRNSEPVKQVVYVTADIKPDGTMSGTAVINSFSYNKSNSLELYKTLDDVKYKTFLTDDDNNLRVTSLKMENADVDSLPLTQHIDFNLDLPGTDDKYIYFSPNLFTSLHNNPFTSKERFSDIDFGCSNLYSINGRYKIPPGYNVDALPKNITLVISDRSISFRRLVGEQDGYIVVNYVISFKKSLYAQENYQDFYAYFKKMNEVLNEQIVLKKSG